MYVCPDIQDMNFPIDYCCRVGVFHLTPEYGLDYVTKCTKEGFHPHPKEPPLFQVNIVIVVL